MTAAEKHMHQAAPGTGVALTRFKAWLAAGVRHPVETVAVNAGTERHLLCVNNDPNQCCKTL